jgi:hypothetical protein
MGHGFCGFTPLAAESSDSNIELVYERPGLPLDSWRVEVNGVVVYQEPEDEEETTIVGNPGTGEED